MESNSVHMPVVNQQIVENIVKQLKSQGIFDQFRKDCLADVDTKPSYQNLRQRVEGYVSKFLSQQSWNSSMNKNQLRDELRRQINESGMLSIGVEHVVDQIVNSKANRVFLPQIEIAARRYLGLDKSEPISEEPEFPKDEKEGDKNKSPEQRDSNQSVEKGRCSPFNKDVPYLLNADEKAQDTTNPIAVVSKDDEVIKELPKIKEPKAPNDYDDYSILNTSRETEVSVSGDDELLPPGVDVEPVKEKEIPVTKDPSEVQQEFNQCDDTSSSFNSEPLVIYDPQESQENSRDAGASDTPKEEEKMEVDNQSSSDTNLPQPGEDSVKEEDKKEESKIEPKENILPETKETIENSEAEMEPNDCKSSGDADDKKSLESEIKKLLELGDKEKLEQEIRRILEIQSKKMVEKELKKRESMEAMKNNNSVNVGIEEAKILSSESMSRSNSSTDLSKDKSSSKSEKVEKSKSVESTSTKSEGLSRSNSSSEIPKEKHTSKSKSSKPDSTSKSSKEAKLQSRDKSKKDHGKSLSVSSSKSNSSKYKSDSKRDSKSVEKSKSSNSSSSGSSKNKSSSSSYTLAKPISKSTSLDKDKKSKSSGSSKTDSNSKSVKTDNLQTSKDKSGSSKNTPTKTTGQKSTSKGTSSSKPKENDKDSSKTPKNKEIEQNEDHIFKSPDINAVEKKNVEFESSETDDDFIRSLNNNKKPEDLREEDKKSDLSVSSVHTSDLSSFDDEISLSSSDEMKTVPIPSPVKEVKKIPLKDIKEITSTIKEKGSGRSTPVSLEETEEPKKKKLKVKNDPLPSVDESSSSQKEDLTSETQTSDDDKGRTGIRSGLRRQRKINPKYASDEYSSIFNKTRKERKSVDETKPSKLQSEAAEPKKRPYSRTMDRKSSKGDSEGETPSKSAKIESNRGSRDKNFAIISTDESESEDSN